MKDPRIQKLAQVLANYSMKIKKGDYLQIQGYDIAQPLIKEVYREAIRNGANVTTDIIIPEIDGIFFSEASDEQLGFVSSVRKLELEELDAILYIWGEYNTKALSTADPEKIKKRSAANSGLFNRMLEKIQKGELNWCGTQFPTHSAAQDANMGLEEYEDFVYGSMLLDREDPVGEWKKVSQTQEKLCRYLEKKKSLHIKSKDTDLKVNICGRKWINDDGQMNFPDGEIFTTPLEDSVEGYIRFSYPGIYMGREIEDIRLEFKEGRVVKASAEKGEDLLLATLDTDEGSRRLGELAFGMNYGIKKFTRNMLFDEKMGGTIHAALGVVPDDTGGKNDSAIHWDLLCDMKESGEVYGDDELIYRDGKFVIEP